MRIVITGTTGGKSRTLARSFSSSLFIAYHAFHEDAKPGDLSLQLPPIRSRSSVNQLVTKTTSDPAVPTFTKLQHHEPRLFRRAGSRMIWYSIVKRREEYTDASGRVKRRTVKVEKSLETMSRGLAEERARAIAREIAEARLTGVTPDTLTLGQVFRAFFRLKAPGLSPEWRQLAETRRDLFEEAWRRDRMVQDISQTDVDTYVRIRRSGELAPDRGGRKMNGVRDATIAHDLAWLSSVFNWARRHKVSGRRLLPDNPLHDVTWPKEKNVRRPVASHQRFLSTLEHVDTVDHDGRVRCILSLLRYTGRRLGAVCELRANDVLRTTDDVRTALAGAGMDERSASTSPHGAIRWSDEYDKVGLLSISPLSTYARESVDAYLRQNPRVGAVPLFPATKNVGQAIRADVVAKWLLRAEEAAGLPKLVGSVAHAYRRLWATERKTLPDVDVAATGGWKSTQALKLSYQHADPATALRVVENR